MKPADMNDTEITEMLQVLMDEGMQGFPAVMTRMYNLAMQFERELHLGAGKCDRTRRHCKGFNERAVGELPSAL